MSARQVAEMTGLSHSYILDLERGINRTTGKHITPTIETLARLSRAYRYSLDELLRIAGYTDIVRDDIRKGIHDIKTLLESPSEIVLWDGEELSDQMRREIVNYVTFLIQKEKQERG
jgi:HTH-type transcriptional regulator, competence development regulator